MKSNLKIFFRSEKKDKFPSKEAAAAFAALSDKEVETEGCHVVTPTYMSWQKTFAVKHKNSLSSFRGPVIFSVEKNPHNVGATFFLREFYSLEEVTKKVTTIQGDHEMWFLEMRKDVIAVVYGNKIYTSEKEKKQLINTLCKEGKMELLKELNQARANALSLKELEEILTPVKPELDTGKKEEGKVELDLSF